MTIPLRHYRKILLSYHDYYTVYREALTNYVSNDEGGGRGLMQKVKLLLMFICKPCNVCHDPQLSDNRAIPSLKVGSNVPEITIKPLF